MPSPADTSALVFLSQTLAQSPCAILCPLRGPWLCPGVGRVLQGGSSSCCCCSSPSPRSKYGHGVSAGVPAVPACVLVSLQCQPECWCPCSAGVPAVPAWQCWCPRSAQGAGQGPCLCPCCPRGCGCCASGTLCAQKGEFNPWIHLGHVNRAASTQQCLSFPLLPPPGHAHPLFPCCPLGTSGHPCPARAQPVLPFQGLGWLLPPRCPRGAR